MAHMVGVSRGPDVFMDLNASRQGRLGASPDTDTAGSKFALGLMVSYELDLWGHLSAERESAVFHAVASEWDAQTVALTVSAETAAVVRTRVQAGSESPLALAQQETLVAKQAASISLLRQQTAQAELLLAQYRQADRLLTAVGLYRALGGAWQAQE